MPLPYYSRDASDLDHAEMGALLYLPDIIKSFGHIIERRIGLLRFPYMNNIISAYLFAENIKYHFDPGIDIIVKIVEMYFELIKLCAALNKYNDMIDIYSISMNYLLEGQNDLYNIDDQLKFIKDRDPEIQYKVLVDKYHTLYEGNLKYTITLAIYCLDIIANQKDIKIKDAKNIAKTISHIKLRK